MRVVATFALILFVGLSSFAQGEKPQFKFEKETINYGKIYLGSNGVRVFEFTNIGKSPLIITRIQTSCDCTVPKRPNEPIMPGEKGKIEVAYDTKKPGGFSKAITIYSNAKNPRKMIKIRGYVERVSAPEKKKSMLSDDN
ncbi:DUF1573 domain-containing protein [Pseudotenacibaculum sp. MALMAid0570]|uniref:DUF1573 domain-containing protein n=1 Tax=Pseudotenacibaculum sp. MALMAid0570 TaxID=3143938 RepID=UPI0032DF3869